MDRHENGSLQALGLILNAGRHPAQRRASSVESGKVAMIASPMNLSMNPPCSAMTGPIRRRYPLMKRKFWSTLILSDMYVKSRMSQNMIVTSRRTPSPSVTPSTVSAPSERRN